MIKTIVDVSKDRVVKLGCLKSSQELKDKVQPFSKYKLSKLNSAIDVNSLDVPSNSLIKVKIVNNELEINCEEASSKSLLTIPLSSTISMNVIGNNFNISWSGNATPTPVPNTNPVPTPNTQPTPSNTVPASVDYYSNASVALGNMYMNDTLGCCVEADIGHQIGVFTSYNGGNTVLFSNGDIVAAYSNIAGYIPGNPNTDQGTDPLIAWNYWKNTGFPSNNVNKIAGYVSVNASNTVEVMEAIDIFETVSFTIDLPDAYINPFPSANGFIWDIAGASDPNNGHCFAGVGYNANGIIINTWGMIGTMTWDAVKQYAVSNSGGALYTMISTEILNSQSQTNPTGLNWTQLEADLQVL